MYNPLNTEQWNLYMTLRSNFSEKLHASAVDYRRQERNIKRCNYINIARTANIGFLPSTLKIIYLITKNIFIFL
jgi:hypothetical protein